MTMVVYESASGVDGTIVLSGRQASNGVLEEQSQFAQHVLERAKF